MTEHDVFEREYRRALAETGQTDLARQQALTETLKVYRPERKTTREELREIYERTFFAGIMNGWSRVQAHYDALRVIENWSDTSSDVEGAIDKALSGGSVS